MGDEEEGTLAAIKGLEWNSRKRAQWAGPGGELWRRGKNALCALCSADRAETKDLDIPTRSQGATVLSLEPSR